MTLGKKVALGACDEDGAGVKNRKDFLRTRFSFISKRKDYL